MSDQLPRRFRSVLDARLPFFLASSRGALYDQSPDFPDSNEGQPELEVTLLMVEARWRCRQVFGVSSSHPLAGAGVIPVASQVAGEMPTLISLVASGAGVSLLPESAAKNSRAAVAGCRVLDRIPISEIALVWRKKGSTTSNRTV
ncbi:MAG: hypothetical protein JO308_18345 [Verrucomicrobia bacterium]|nr:hypothetical protein [Verrucomicrobiota bacterium]